MSTCMTSYCVESIRLLSSYKTRVSGFYSGWHEDDIFSVVEDDCEFVAINSVLIRVAEQSKTLGTVELYRYIRSLSGGRDIIGAALMQRVVAVDTALERLEKLP